MKVQLAVIADQANVSGDGKLNVLGVFNNIFAYQMPTVHLKMYLVMQYVIETSDRGQTRHIALKFRDPDGTDLLGLDAREQFTADAPLIVTNPQIIELTLIRFEKFGEYHFAIEVDDQVLATIPLRLVQVPTPPES
ncbi:MAG: DUF6941 family protein [Ktedonobacterales bacterium]